MRALVLTLVLTLVGALCACQTVAERKATAESEGDPRDRAACEKMCEVAGAAEDAADGVDGCKAKCVAPPSGPAG